MPCSLNRPTTSPVPPERLHAPELTADMARVPTTPWGLGQGAHLVSPSAPLSKLSRGTSRALPGEPGDRRDEKKGLGTLEMTERSKAGRGSLTDHVVPSGLMGSGRERG